MCPLEAKVFIAEDDLEWQENFGLVLGFAGHSVVSSATTLNDALEAVDHFDELGIQIAVLDGNLRKGVVDGSDGRKIIEKIRDNAPAVKIVGVSSDMMDGVDEYLGKGTKVFELGEVVTNL